MENNMSLNAMLNEVNQIVGHIENQDNVEKAEKLLAEGQKLMAYLTEVQMQSTSAECCEYIATLQKFIQNGDAELVAYCEKVRKMEEENKRLSHSIPDNQSAHNNDYSPEQDAMER